MHIENINITMLPHPPSMALAFLDSLFSGPESKPAQAPKDKPIATSSAPKIGEPWPGHGGIYCGISRGEEGQPDAHLILADLAPDRDFTWKDALEFAKTVEADGHADFHVPTRFESALLYANVRDQLDTERWHWTSTQYSEYDAFSQYFDYGNQYDFYNKAEGRVRFVRLIQLDS